MKTDLLTINCEPEQNNLSLEEIERAGLYCGLTARQAGTLRLLAEESIAMTLDLLDQHAGTIWLETSAQTYDLHLTVAAPVSDEARRSFIAVSRARRNTPPKSLTGRISCLLSDLLSAYLSEGNAPEIYGHLEYGFTGEMPAATVPSGAASWSLSAYRQQAPVDLLEDPLALEKSIIERFADDVLVTVTAKGVSLLVRKIF